MNVKLFPFVLGILISVGCGFLILGDIQSSVSTDDNITEQKAVELEQIVKDHAAAEELEVEVEAEEVEAEVEEVEELEAEEVEAEVEEVEELEAEELEVEAENSLNTNQVLDDEKLAMIDAIKNRIRNEIEETKKTDKEAMERIEEVSKTLEEDGEEMPTVVVTPETTLDEEMIDTFVYRLYGELNQSADYIDVLARNDGEYGLMDHYRLQKFEKGDTSREYFIKPSFGTILPGNNSYTVKIGRSDGTTTETIHEISLESASFDFVTMQTAEEGVSDPETDQYAGLVTLRGHVSTERVPYCTAGWGFDIQACHELGMIEYTQKYVFNVLGSSDPRRYMFDDVADHKRIDLGCVGDPGFVRRHASKFGAGAVGQIYTAGPSEEMKLTLRKEYTMGFADDGYCGIAPEISFIQ